MLKIFFTLLIFLLSTFSSLANAELTECRVGLSESWDEPLTFPETQGGIIVEISQKVAERMNCRPTFIKLPRIRLEKNLETNRIHLICHSNPNWMGKNIAQFHWSPPTFSNPDIIIYKKSTAKPKQPSLDTLPVTPIAVVAGYRYFNLSGEMQLNFVRDESRSTKAVFKKVLEDRAAYGVLSKIQYEYLVKSLPDNERKKFAEPTVLNQTHVHCVLNPSWGMDKEKFIEIFDNNFQLEINQILKKYKPE